MDAEVVVVGAGIVGASIALQLARRGVGVLLVDAEAPAAGMSGRSFRQVRTHYSNEVTTRLARRGIEILRGWGEHVGVGDSGFEPVGYPWRPTRRTAARPTSRWAPAWGCAPSSSRLSGCTSSSRCWPPMAWRAARGSRTAA